MCSLCTEPSLRKGDHVRSVRVQAEHALFRKPIQVIDLTFRFAAIRVGAVASLTRRGGPGNWAWDA